MPPQHQDNRWFYDDRGYYSYVLLNTSQNNYHEIQSALKKDGIRVLKAASSFRPANNGIQYKWYIRVENENFSTPSSERISSIVTQVLNAAIPSIHAHETELEQLKEQGLTLQSQIVELTKRLKQKNTENKNISDSLARIQKEREILLAQLKAQKDEFEISQQEIDKLNQRVVSLYKPKDVEALRKQYDHRLKELKTQIAAEQSKFQQYLDTFGTNENVIQDLKNQIAILEQEKTDSIHEQNDIYEQRQDEIEKGAPEFLFTSMIEVLLPNIDFLRGSLQIMWELPNNATIRALSQIHSIENLTAKRVQCDKRWKEYYKKNNQNPWRMYFRKCKNGKYEVLVSDKDTQEKRDWDWLKRQPNC